MKLRSILTKFKLKRYIRVNETYMLDLRKLKLKKFGKIGINVRISEKCEFYNSENLYLGNHLFIGRECYIDAVSEIRIGDGTCIGPRVTMISSNHNYDSNNLNTIPYDNYIIEKKIIIDENVWIGAEVKITPGSLICEGAVCAMGSVIRGHVDELSIVGGNPSKVIKYRENKELYFKLKSESKQFNKVYRFKKCNNKL